MTLLPSTEINAMRDTLAESLPDSAVIESRSWVSDGRGGGSVTWTPSGTVDCRLSPSLRQASDREGEVGERLISEADWIVTLPAATSIDQEDRIVIGSTTYNVFAIEAPRSWELVRRVEANKEV